MITQTIDLNLIPGGILPRINVSQYDTGSRTLNFNLYNGVSAFTVPTGSSVYIVGTKADKTGFEYACTYSGSVVTADITDQMTVFPGDVEIEIRIIKDGNQIATGNFILAVEKTALDDDTQISETDLPIIQNLPTLIAEAESAANTAHQWATYGSSTEQPSATNNAKYYAEQAELYAQGGLKYKGSILFANIPTTGMVEGDMYNMEEDFTTDSRFQEGAGVEVKAGTNIAWNSNDKWDVLAVGAAGHVIKNPSGTAMSQRDALQFTGNVEVVDDLTNGKTIVDVKGEPSYEYDTYAEMMADWANIEDGAKIYVKEEGNPIVSSESVSYDNSDSGLDADRVKGAIDELASDVADISSDLSELNCGSGYVSYTPSSSETVQQALNALYSLIDRDKITPTSKFRFAVGGTTIIATLTASTSSNFAFSTSDTNTIVIIVRSFNIGQSNSSFIQTYSGQTPSDYSSNNAVATLGSTLTIIY